MITGGGAVIDWITSIPSEWVWFSATIALTLGIPPTIRASAELRSASADLIHAASGKQKLDQAEMGLRGPKAAKKLSKKVPKNRGRLEQLYNEGEKLLERDKSIPAGEWRQNIINWFDQSELAVKEEAANEDFMFRTVSQRPKPNEKFDDCLPLLAAKLVKLRLIIGRMQGKQDD